jgi:hypothetical protein
MKRALAVVGGVGLAIYGAVAFWSRNKDRASELDKPARKFTKRAKRSLRHFESDTEDAAEDVKDSAAATRKDLGTAGHDAARDWKHRVFREPARTK